jgi:hypothetical protein
LKKKDLDFDIGKKFYIWVLLLEPAEADQKPEKLKLWFKGLVRNVFEDEGCSCVTIGMQFEDSGRCTQQTGGDLISWESVPKGGYEPLSNWIAKLHLDMLRAEQRDDDGIEPPK